MFCEFFEIEENKFKCIKCDTIVEVADDFPEPPHLLCRSYMVLTDNQKEDSPSISTKAKNFVSSLYGHIKNGMELCPESVIENRYSICQQCEFFQNSTCQKCGCPLMRDRIFVSKLAWASEKCPINKWDQYH